MTRANLFPKIFGLLAAFAIGCGSPQPTAARAQPTPAPARSSDHANETAPRAAPTPSLFVIEITPNAAISPEQQQLLRHRIAESLERAAGFTVANPNQTTAQLEQTLRDNGARGILVVFVITDAQAGSTNTEARLCLLPGAHLLGGVPIKLTAMSDAGTTMELLELAAKRSGEKIVDNLSPLLKAVRDADLDTAPEKRPTCR